METTVKITTLSSRELTRDISRAKKAAEAGPVIITDHGRPRFVLITYDEFERLSGKRRNLVDALAMLGLSTVDIEPSRITIEPREADLS
ncbi:type II toxin-antitoxin system Phd/YefM family antitoxin [Ensifer sp. 22564]|uniref:type II toxin-antitoxin system Phd/YefM family antitoxin n=1 Tax=unclassified Ensifer TaxID=2633371 RepID=UPI003F876D83